MTRSLRIPLVAAAPLALAVSGCGGSSAPANNATRVDINGAAEQAQGDIDTYASNALQTPSEAATSAPLPPPAPTPSPSPSASPPLEPPVLDDEGRFVRRDRFVQRPQQCEIAQGLLSRQEVVVLMDRQHGGRRVDHLGAAVQGVRHQPMVPPPASDGKPRHGSVHRVREGKIVDRLRSPQHTVPGCAAAHRLFPPRIAEIDRVANVQVRPLTDQQEVVPHPHRALGLVMQAGPLVGEPL